MGYGARGDTSRVYGRAFNPIQCSARQSTRPPTRVRCKVVYPAQHVWNMFGTCKEGARPGFLCHCNVWLRHGADGIHCGGVGDLTCRARSGQPIRLDGCLVGLGDLHAFHALQAGTHKAGVWADFISWARLGCEADGFIFHLLFWSVVVLDMRKVSRGLQLWALDQIIDCDMSLQAPRRTPSKNEDAQRIKLKSKPLRQFLKPGVSDAGCPLKPPFIRNA